MTASNFKKKKPKDEYEYIYGNDDNNYSEHEKMESVKGTTAGKCYRHLCSGTMTLQDNIFFICDRCNRAIEKQLYYRWLVGLANLEEDDDFEDFPDYEDVYDENGYDVPCDTPGCSSNIKFHNGQYACPSCESVMSREEFFNYIGIEPLNKKCLNCNHNYPQCKEYCEIYGND